MNHRGVHTAAHVLLLALAIMAVPIVTAAATPPSAPLVSLLTPRDGTALNGDSLRIQALVSSLQPDDHASFVFDGTRVTGRNAGALDQVEVAIDHQVVAQVTAAPCRRELLLDERVDLTALADGPHTLTVTAYQIHARRPGVTTVTTSFTLDRTLPVTVPSLIEQVATPAPFACLKARDDDDDEDDDGPRPSRPEIHGRFVVGEQSDGIDLTRDRVLIAAGGETAVLEPGTLRCDKRGRVCRYENVHDPFLQRLVLSARGDRGWRFQIAGGPSWPRDAQVHLRIGANWGALDLATGERLARLREAPDVSHRAQATIGTAGGAVETIDAAGVKIHVEVPAGALTRDTVITVTPLTASPLVGEAGALHPGVTLEPDGLAFATPATLTLDFSATGQAIGSQDFVFLLTSPSTIVPMFGTTDASTKTVTALLEHFSPYQPGSGTVSFVDLAVRGAQRLLTSGRELTQSDLQMLLMVVALQQQQRNCGANCLDLGLLASRVQQSIDAKVNRNCQADVDSPSGTALRGWIDLDQLGQQLGADTSSLRTCEQNILRALINKDGDAALVDGSEQNLVNLDADHRTAQLMGFSDLEDLALQKLDAALRALLERGRALCPTDTPTALAMLNRALSWASKVSSIDPSLATDILAAINGCGQASSSGITVRVTQGNVDAWGISHNSGTIVLVDRTSLFGYHPGCDEGCGDNSSFGGPASLPVSATAGGVTVDVTQTSPTSVTVRKTAVPYAALADDVPGISVMFGDWTLEIDLPSAGSLAVTVDGRNVGAIPVTLPCDPCAGPATVTWKVRFNLSVDTVAAVTFTFTPSP